MNFNIVNDTPVQLASDCLVIGVIKGGLLSNSGKLLDAACNQHLSKILNTGDLEGKNGETLLLHNLAGITAERVLLVGCGEQDKISFQTLREAASSATGVLQKTGSENAVFCLAELAPDNDQQQCLRHMAEAISVATYRYEKTKTKKEPPAHPLQTIGFYLESGATEAINDAVQIGQAIGAGIALARDLGNLPGNICTPTYLAESAVSMGKELGLKTTVLEEADMEKLGMGSLLSVSRGSVQPAKFIIMEYNGGGTEAPIVLVGKGLTFDAGGISIKPAAAMDEMKFDMCGGASVFGAIKAVAQLKLPINVIGVVPSSENLPDGDANKPGDVVTSMSGQTIEILNTDAEGRLILCDALTYSERFKPQAVIDIATLTGACVIALGAHASGLLSNDDELADEILDCGRQANDRAWQLPLWEDYQKQLDSNFADMANVGGREAGTITAACFLSRYTKAYKWAHLDIAGTAWTKGHHKGATGRPVGLLTQFCINRARGVRR